MDHYYDESHILESATPYTDAIRVSNVRLADAQNLYLTAKDCNFRQLNLKRRSIWFQFAEEKALRAAYQAASEPLHGLESDWAPEADILETRPPSRRDLQIPGQEMGPALHPGAEAIRGGGGEAEGATHDGVPGLQVQAQEEEDKEVSFPASGAFWRGHEQRQQ